MRKSLLDSPAVPSRTARPGMTRDMMAPSDADGSGKGMEYRAYCETMTRKFGYVPTLGEIILAATTARTCFDSGVRDKLVNTLARTHVGFDGPRGGFVLATGLAEDVFDRARAVVGPWSLCNWLPVETREYRIPVVSESSRANGSRFGGVVSSFGNSEIMRPPASDGKVGCIDLSNQRLQVWTILSRDLWQDSGLINRWLDYVAIAEFRSAIEGAMISGGGIAAPQSVINAPSTVTVAKDSGQSAGTITAKNIDNLWSSISAGNKPNAVWHTSSETVAVLDGLAVSGQFPENLYFPAGSSPVGTPFATIKGRPLIESDFCQPIGTPGDLIVVDWSDYVLTYLKPKKGSPLSFDLRPPGDGFHTGLVGLPEGAVEGRASEDLYFDADEIAFAFKMRCSGAFLWNGPCTNRNGQPVGPAAIIAQR
jgi:HK97 family phage major capsid protein